MRLIAVNAFISTDDVESEDRGDPMIAQTGKKIREIRTARKLSMATLAETVGVSKSLISQIERGEVLPSLTTLEKIAVAMDVAITEFFGVEERPHEEQTVVVRKNERKKVLLPNTDKIYHVLTPNFKNHIEFLIIEFPPKSNKEDYDLFKHEGEECFLVLDGSFTLMIDGNRFDLEEGDSGSFDSGKKHIFINNSSKKGFIVLATNAGRL